MYLSVYVVRLDEDEPNMRTAIFFAKYVESVIGILGGANCTHNCILLSLTSIISSRERESGGGGVLLHYYRYTELNLPKYSGSTRTGSSNTQNPTWIPSMHETISLSLLFRSSSSSSPSSLLFSLSIYALSCAQPCACFIR